MRLAGALLRIPDSQTRDARIRDNIGHGDWKAHVGQSPSIFVNAATWGLVSTGRLVGTSSENKLASALTRVLKQGGELVEGVLTVDGLGRDLQVVGPVDDEGQAHAGGSLVIDDHHRDRPEVAR